MAYKDQGALSTSDFPIAGAITAQMVYWNKTEVYETYRSGNYGGIRIDIVPAYR